MFFPLCFIIKEKTTIFFFPKGLVVTNKSLIFAQNYKYGVDKVKYWKELADYDIDTAEVMYNGGIWLYVGFMRMQSINR